MRRLTPAHSGFNITNFVCAYNLLQQQGAQELTKSVTSPTYWASASIIFVPFKCCTVPAFPKIDNSDVRCLHVTLYTTRKRKQGKMNSHQQIQRVSELRMRRWGRSEATANTSISSSELELSLRSSSLNTSFSTSETICETATTSSPSTRERRSGGSFNSISRTASTAGSDSPVNFEFCRAGSGPGQSVYHGGGSRATSPLLNGSSPCPSPTSRSPRSPMTPRSPRSPRSPCRSPSSQQPSPGHQTPTSASSPHRYSSRRRSGAATGNLARLASRRSSRDSEAGEPTPLKCVRNQQRRTSNFLEIPGEFILHIHALSTFAL